VTSCENRELIASRGPKEPARNSKERVGNILLVATNVNVLGAFTSSLVKDRSYLTVILLNKGQYKHASIWHALYALADKHKITAESGKLPLSDMGIK